jgi:transcription antitermination factor NusB
VQEAHPNREGRERAVELLYEADTKGVHPAEVVAALPVAPQPLAATLAEGVGDHLALLDHLIGERARGWTVARMPVVDRTLLRLGTYELAFDPDQPEGVVISEAVALATRFSTDDSPKFVNGVLSAMVEQVRGGGPWRNVSCPAALLVDMDGVVRNWSGADLLAADEALGLEPGTYAAVALEPDRIRRANDGSITDEDWRAEVAATLVADHGCDHEAALGAWGTDGFSLDDAVVDLVRAVRATGVPTVCLSNATTRLEADLAERGIADAFTAVVNSSHVRSLKPDAAIDLAAAEAAGAAPGDCLFVDDRPENVDGALAVGMSAVTFLDADRLGATLRRVGLLPVT